MRISDWSSDVCSSDLLGRLFDSLSGLNLTAGARYTFDSTEGHAHINQTALGVLTTVDTAYDASVKDQALTYTLGQIGSAACRERVCQYVELSVVALSLKKKKTTILETDKKKLK